MKGDRVVITNHTGTFIGAPDTSGQGMIFVYMPIVGEDGHFRQANDGTILIESKGGVNKGSTGTIHGDPITIHKTQLRDFEGVVGMGNNDVITMFPIFLDRYQQLGWFPANVIKIMGGGVGA